MNRTLRSVLVLTLAVTLLPLLADRLGAEDHAFIGASKCKKCHLKEFKSWAETSMAKTFEVLRPGERAEAKTAAGLDPDKDYTTDPACVRCHVTGMGAPGGFVDFESTPDLAGVGCEACHGAGGTYTQDHLMSLKNKEYKRAEVVAAGMVEKVSADQCTGCHNGDSPFVADDFVFDFEANQGEGTHENFPLKYNHD